MKRPFHPSAIAALLVMTSSACATAETRPDAARFPEALLGIWEAGVESCKSPGNLDGDQRIEIRPAQRIGYEDRADVTGVVQVSDDPLAWKIQSLVHYGSDTDKQQELYILHRQDRGVLAIANASQTVSYVRCL